MSGHLIDDMEKLSISACLKNATTSGYTIPLQICGELTFDKFESQEHKLIYKAIHDVVMNSDIPTISNVLLALGEDGDKVGGEPALRGLLNFADTMNITDINASWENAITVVDIAGKGRAVHGVLDSSKAKFSDLPGLVYSHFNDEDFDKMLANLIEDLTIAKVFGTKSSYKHVSSLYEQELERLSMEKEGFNYNCLPVMFPSFAKYGVPRIGVLNVISGLTSSGKTQLAVQQFLGFGLWLLLSGSNDYATYNALENSALNLYRRMVCCLQGIDSTRLEHNIATDYELKRYNQGMLILNKLPLLINDKSVITSKEVMLEQALLKHRRKGRRVLGVYDYIELFNDGDKEGETIRLSNITRNLQAYASDNFTCEILLTQYPNLDFGNHIGGLKARFSGAISDGCKCFMEMWNYKQLKNYPQRFPKFRDKEIPSWANSDYAYVIIHKHTEGKPGQFPLRWQPEFTRFSEPEFKADDMYSLERLRSCLNNKN